LEPAELAVKTPSELPVCKTMQEQTQEPDDTPDVIHVGPDCQVCAEEILAENNLCCDDEEANNRYGFSQEGVVCGEVRWLKRAESHNENLLDEEDAKEEDIEKKLRNQPREQLHEQMIKKLNEQMIKKLIFKEILESKDKDKDIVNHAPVQLLEQKQNLLQPRNPPLLHNRQPQEQKRKQCALFGKTA